MSDFYDFLSKMGDETGARKESRFEPSEQVEEESEFQEQTEENELEENEIEEDSTMNDSNDLDIIEKSLDYSKSVIKVIRENFSIKDQKVMLETLRNTLNMTLGNVSENRNYQQPIPQPSYQPSSQKTINVQDDRVSAMLKGATMTEEQWNNLPDGVDYNPSYQYQSPAAELRMNPKAQINENKKRSYSKDLSLGLTIGSNGKTEVDLSKVSNQDIEDMKVLAGMK